ncbi:hypothetical protein THAOC_32184 [Thalassiosira oceanica]|uniref:MGS-like domain-containing protein n=1 Tax=Thalassiosira oceanica TaxID=159749 RepID=K0R6I2_THAOC|nr:hypothetical protein THAOC_32184 [Thalassiosira oceanica]|eukprot:EJK48978.1 hypothetical protein THAOC_32184 [Thalassiosira oceanica]
MSEALRPIIEPFHSLHSPTGMRQLALIAHNHMKPVMHNFIIQYGEVLRKFRVTGTETTMSICKREWKDKEGVVYGETCTSGPLGGDAEISSSLVRGDIGAVVFFIDPLSPHPHQADIDSLCRLCIVHDVPIMHNRSSAIPLVLMLKTALETPGMAERVARLGGRGLSRDMNGHSMLLSSEAINEIQEEVNSTMGAARPLACLYAIHLGIAFTAPAATCMLDWRKLSQTGEHPSHAHLEAVSQPWRVLRKPSKMTSCPRGNSKPNQKALHLHGKRCIFSCSDIRQVLDYSGVNLVIGWPGLEAANQTRWHRHVALVLDKHIPVVWPALEENDFKAPDYKLIARIRGLILVKDGPGLARLEQSKARRVPPRRVDDEKEPPRLSGVRVGVRLEQRLDVEQGSRRVLARLECAAVEVEEDLLRYLDGEPAVPACVLEPDLPQQALNDRRQVTVSLLRSALPSDGPVGHEALLLVLVYGLAEGQAQNLPVVAALVEGSGDRSGRLCDTVRRSVCAGPYVALRRGLLPRPRRPRRRASRPARPGALAAVVQHSNTHTAAWQFGTAIKKAKFEYCPGCRVRFGTHLSGGFHPRSGKLRAKSIPRSGTLRAKSAKNNDDDEQWRGDPNMSTLERCIKIFSLGFEMQQRLFKMTASWLSMVERFLMMILWNIGGLWVCLVFQLRNTAGYSWAQIRRRLFNSNLLASPQRQRIDALEDALGALKEAHEVAHLNLEGEMDALRREVHALQRDRKAQEQENVVLREEIAILKYGEASSTPMFPEKRGELKHLALATLGDDAMVHLASFLGAKGLAGLAQTCKIFGRGHIGAKGQVSSIVEELARRVFDVSATNHEKSLLVVPQDNRIKLLQELEEMRLPLSFKQLIGSADVIGYPHPGDKSVVSLFPFGGAHNVTVISNQVMRVGRHYVTFHISGTEGAPIYFDFGVIRPVKDWEKKGLYNLNPLHFGNDHRNCRKLLLFSEQTDEWGEDLHCCSFNSREGKCFSSKWSNADNGGEQGDQWVGMEPIPMTGDLTLIGFTT